MQRLSGWLRSACGKDGSILLDIAQGRVFELNPVAARIISLMAEAHSTAEIVERISHEFDTTHERVSDDLKAFIEILLDNKLVEDHPDQNR
jgi:hypothetical protein